MYNQAFVPEQLDKQLDSRTRVMLNFETCVDPYGGQLALCKAMDRYRVDFVVDKSLIAWINDYRDRPIAEGMPIVYAEYDWKLN